MGWNDDGIHKRGTVYYVSWRDATGFHEKSARTQDYREAVDFRRRMVEPAKNEELPNDKAKWPLQRAVDHFNSYRKAVVSEDTAAKEGRLLKPVLAFFGGATPLHKIADIDRVRAYQVARRRMISRTMRREVQPRTP